MRLRKVISGGQTGADRGGLEAGRLLGLETGGWAPRGWRTEAGPDFSLPNFGLRERPDRGYPPRTRANIRDSDATVVFDPAKGAGSRLTVRCARDSNWECLVLDAFDALALANLACWLRRVDPEVLNVAGNRESSRPGIRRDVANLLVGAVEAVGVLEAFEAPGADRGGLR